MSKKPERVLVKDPKRRFHYMRIDPKLVDEELVGIEYTPSIAQAESVFLQINTRFGEYRGEIKKGDVLFCPEAIAKDYTTGTNWTRFRSESEVEDG